jgi:hypothetical protein
MVFLSCIHTSSLFDSTACMYKTSWGWTLGCSKNVEDTISKLFVVLIIYTYFSFHQTQIYHTLGSSVLGRYTRCEIVNFLNKKSNNQQGDKIRDSLVITAEFASRVGLVTGLMDMRFRGVNIFIYIYIYFLRLKVDVVSAPPPPPPAQEYPQRHNRGKLR